MSILELQNVSFSYDNSKSLRKNSLFAYGKPSGNKSFDNDKSLLKSRFFLRLISRLNHTSVLPCKLLRGLEKPLYVVYWRGI